MIITTLAFSGRATLPYEFGRKAPRGRHPAVYVERSMCRGVKRRSENTTTAESLFDRALYITLVVLSVLVVAAVAVYG
jgi:hypothetical protein